MKEIIKKYWWALIIALIYLVVGIWILPEQYIKYFYNIPIEKEKLDAIKDIRIVFIQIGAGALALIGIYLTWRRTNELKRQNDISQKNYEELIDKSKRDNEENEKKFQLEKDKFRHEKAEDERKRLQEREVNYNNIILQQFSKASELLKDENISARLSGIYLFEKIMNENEEYHWQIIELLTAFIREKRDNKKFDVDFSNESDHPYIEIDEKNKSKCYVVVDSYKYDDNNNIIQTNIKFYYRVPIEKDIQAIITVLGRRNRKFEKEKRTGKNLEELIEELNNLINNNNKNKTIEIEDISLIIQRIKKVDLSNVNFYYANFEEAHFENANFVNTQFIKTNCYGAYFNNAIFIKAHFRFSNCTYSYFTKAICKEANFVNSVLTTSNFIRANCTDSFFCNMVCTGAFFKFANISKANFEYSSLEFSHFENATCIDTIFKNTLCDSTHFEYSNISKANFEYAECKATIFDESSCYQTNFKNTKCLNASFKSADCSNSNFDYSTLGSCNFEDTDFTGASFIGAKGLEAKQLAKSRSLPYDSKGLSSELIEEINRNRANIF